METLSKAKYFITQMSVFRKCFYTLLVIVVICASVAELRLLHRASLYERGVETLQAILHQQLRFQDVQVHLSTRPSARILAPDTLPQLDKDDLLQIVAKSFAPLPCPLIQYAGTDFFGPSITNLQRLGSNLRKP